MHAAPTPKQCGLGQATDCSDPPRPHLQNADRAFLTGHVKGQGSTLSVRLVKQMIKSGISC